MYNIPAVLLRRTVDLTVLTLVFALFVVGVALDICHNPRKRGKQYRKIRTLNWIVLGWGRAVKTMIRYSFFSLSTEIGSSYLNLTNTEYSTVSTIGIWTMPIGMLLNGYLVDKFRERAIMQFSLLSNLVVNAAFAAILFFAGGTMFAKIACFIYFPAVCYFLSFSEVVINKNNATWYEESERGVIAGIFTLCIAIGYCLGLAGNSLAVSITNSPPLLFTIYAVLLGISALSCHFCLVEEVPTYTMLDEMDILEDPFVIQQSKSPQRVGSEEDTDAGHTSNKISSDEEKTEEQKSPKEEEEEEDREERRKKRKEKLLEKLEKLKKERKDPSVSSVVLNYEFISMAICFNFVGMLRDGFFVWLNQYLQVRYKVAIGSPEQLLTFASLTVGAALSAFFSAFLSLVFKAKYSWNGVICFLLAFICYFVLSLASNVWLVVLMIGASTVFIMSVLSIRRVLSMSLGGKSNSGFITGILAAATFAGGGIGSGVFELFIRLDPSYTLLIVSLAIIAASGAFIFGSIGAKEFITALLQHKKQPPQVGESGFIATRLEAEGATEVKV